MFESLIALLCAGGIYSLVPYSTWYKKYKVKKDWYKVMNLTKTKNNIDETFEVKEIDLYRNDSVKIKVKVPIGLTPENLRNLEKTLEYRFGGDIDIYWDKYDGLVSIKVNKDPKIKKESIRSRWTKILSNRSVTSRFSQYFEITDVTLNNNSKYILTIMTPISLSRESLTDFKSVIEQNLLNEAIESFHTEHNDIFITISRKSEKDSL
jgi:F0F1-type ATP synthase delta subunit